MASPPGSTSAMRSAYAAYLCDPDNMTRVPFPGDGRTWDLLVADPTAPAWEVFGDVQVRHGVLFLESAGGTYNCRQIAGSDEYSLHAYGLALDLNPSKNPHRSPLTTNFPDPFVDAVNAVHTGSGRQVFQWGGGWSTPDAMHFQIGATPTELATGIIDPGKEPDDMPLTDGEMKEIARLVWQYEGQFAKDDQGDTAQKTLVRLEGKVDTLEGKVDKLLDRTN